MLIFFRVNFERELSNQTYLIILGVHIHTRVKIDEIRLWYCTLDWTPQKFIIHIKGNSEVLWIKNTLYLVSFFASHWLIGLYDSWLSIDSSIITIKHMTSRFGVISAGSWFIFLNESYHQITVYWNLINVYLKICFSLFKDRPVSKNTVPGWVIDNFFNRFLLFWYLNLTFIFILEIKFQLSSILTKSILHYFQHLISIFLEVRYSPH